MFILTLDTHNPDHIRECLKELSTDKTLMLHGHGSIGEVCGVDMECDCIGKWYPMADFLHFNEDKNTLKTVDGTAT